uniref:Uncharacterized protein n=1 Tax=Rousettus aegyptiacus TaxID=9407 RepID=A0A7J8BFG6_ROUAE|nr:hypothetical protein HJG63_009871 [Rousettus aegyptiacus]
MRREGGPARLWWRRAQRAASVQRRDLFLHPQKRLLGSIFLTCRLSPPPVRFFLLPPTCGSRNIECLAGQSPVAVGKARASGTVSGLEPAPGRVAALPAQPRGAQGPGTAVLSCGGGSAPRRRAANGFLFRLNF